MQYKPLIFVIDDERAILKSLKNLLEDEDFRVEILENPNFNNVSSMVGELIPDLILLDISMPNVNGIDLLENIKREYPQQKVFIISGFGSIPIALNAMKKGASDFIEKPLNFEEILSKICFLKEEKPLSNNVENDKDDLYTRSKYGIIGESYLFKELMKHIEKIAILRLPILIYGKCGTGKTMVANYIHRISSNNTESFYLFDCAGGEEAVSIPNSVVNYETLFLKNVDHLDLKNQKKILALMEKNEAVNGIRIIASSQASLFEKVQLKQFEEMLFYRLNILPIEIPSLCKRRYDIPLLLDHFLKIENKRNKKTIHFSSTCIRILRNLNWKGNISELKNFIKQMICIAPYNHYLFLPQELQKYISEKEISFVEEQSFMQFDSLQEATTAFEKKFLTYLLKKNRYDIIQVSDRLHLKTPQLRAKMLELNIELKG
jgi:two-component system, NtrC family, nitrogen regulation response regulator NtrX